MEKDEDQLILAILTKLNADYSVFVSTFQTVRLTTPNWKIPTLNAFIQSPKYLALVARGDKVVNDKGKQRDESPVKKEQAKDPSGSKRSKKNGKDKVLCS